MFSIIKSGMSSAMHELSVISNNVSNANSNGFKKSLVAFSDFAGGLLPDAVQNSSGGMGSFVDETRISDGQGAVLATENITVLQNQVQTASFDVKDRVLTIPFFKHKM